MHHNYFLFLERSCEHVSSRCGDGEQVDESVSTSVVWSRVSCCKSECSAIGFVGVDVLGAARLSVIPSMVARFAVIDALLMLSCGLFFPTWWFLVSCCFWLPARLANLVVVVVCCWSVGNRFCRCLRIREVMSVVLYWSCSLVGCYVHGLMVFAHQVQRLLLLDSRDRSCAFIFAKVAGFGLISVVRVPTVFKLLFFPFSYIYVGQHLLIREGGGGFLLLRIGFPAACLFLINSRCGRPVDCYVWFNL